MFCAVHESVTEFDVCVVLVKFAGAVGAVTFVVAFVIEETEPPAFVAVKRKSYNVFAVRPVIVAVVAATPGAGVHVVQVDAVDNLYSNV